MCQILWHEVICTNHGQTISSCGFLQAFAQWKMVLQVEDFQDK